MADLNSPTATRLEVDMLIAYRHCADYTQTGSAFQKMIVYAVGK
jgi:hypothetical protein